MQQIVPISTNPQDAYLRQNVMTARSVDLIVILYDALKKNIILGKRGIARSDAHGAHKHLMKAQEILTELVNSLDMNYPIAEELLSLYEYFLKNLEDANLRKDPEPLEPVIDMVDTLRSAWDEISKTNKGSLYVSEEQA